MIGPDAVLAALDAVLERGEVGLQVAAYLGGELVVDAWAGTVAPGGAPVTRDTVFWAASAGKASTATALHVQVAKGLIGYDDLIGSVWPEFAVHGKQSMTVRDAVTHRVGLPVLPEGATPERQGDWEWMTGQLARSAPTTAPGMMTAYHPTTWGYIVGEIARRSDPERRSFPDLVRDEVLQPLGIRDLWHLFPASKSARVAKLCGQLVRAGRPALDIGPDDERNEIAFWTRVNPSGAMMTARAGARLYSLYAHGGEVGGSRLLPAATVHSFLTPRDHCRDIDGAAGRVRLIGQGGFWLGGLDTDAEAIVGFGRNVLWHPGGGGTVGFADLDADLAVMICHNRFYDWEGLPLADHPFAPLVTALYAELAGHETAVPATIPGHGGVSDENGNLR